MRPTEHGRVQGQPDRTRTGGGVATVAALADPDRQPHRRTARRVGPAALAAETHARRQSPATAAGHPRRLPQPGTDPHRRQPVGRAAAMAADPAQPGLDRLCWQSSTRSHRRGAGRRYHAEHRLGAIATRTAAGRRRLRGDQPGRVEPSFGGGQGGGGQAVQGQHDQRRLAAERDERLYRRRPAPEPDPGRGSYQRPSR